MANTRDQVLEDLFEEVLVAFEHEEYEKAKAILEEFPNINVNDINPGGWKPLHFTADVGDLDFSIYLVKVRNSNVNTRNNIGKTALMKCAFAGHLNVCQFLLENGADLHIKDDVGETAFMLACKNGHLNVCEFLLAKENIDLNTQSDEGATAFLLAAEHGHIHVCKYLQEQGAETSIKDNHGRTALMNATFKGFLNACQYLRENGADLDTQDKHGETALYIAARTRHRDIAIFLLENGANLLLKDEHGQTPIRHVYSKGDLELLKQCTFAGAIMSETDLNTFFSIGVTIETRNTVREYASKQLLRQTVLLLLTAKVMKPRSLIKLLNVDLIRQLFYMLGGSKGD